jgi:16S rRNA G1207 methylase RsmC
MLQRAPRKAGDAFLDIGCGKGYVLAFVEKSGLFDRVDGIEISARLCEIARRNLAKLGCRAGVCQIAAEDFADYDRYTHFYMFNPCAPQAVARIESALAASLRRSPRQAHLFYSHPESTASWERWSESIEQDEARIDGYPHRLVHFTLSAAKAAALS